MLIFKSMHDLDQLAPTDPAYAVVRKHCQTIVNPEDRGYLVLIQKGARYRGRGGRSLP